MELNNIFLYFIPIIIFFKVRSVIKAVYDMEYQKGKNRTLQCKTGFVCDNPPLFVRSPLHAGDFSSRAYHIRAGQAESRFFPVFLMLFYRESVREAASASAKGCDAPGPFPVIIFPETTTFSLMYSAPLSFIILTNVGSG